MSDYEGRYYDAMSDNETLSSELESLRQRNDDLVTGLEACDEQVVALRQQLEEFKHGQDAYQQMFNDSQKQVNTARDYLERLACLGNGNRHGNSNGNCLAIEALAAMEPK
jgi:chromosome segregation ATPase